MIDHTASTHGTERSRAFQISAEPPARVAAPVELAPAPRSASNQWNAWATVIASSDAVGEGQRFGGRRDRGHAGHGRAEHARASRRPARPRRARAPVRREQPGELAGAGGEVGDDRGPVRCASALDEPRDRVGWVRGPGPLVGVGFGAEAREPRRRGRSSGSRDGVQPWRPHSSLPLPAQRPARGSSPSLRPGWCTASSRSTGSPCRERVLGQVVVGDVAVDVVVGPRARAG